MGEAESKGESDDILSLSTASPPLPPPPLSSPPLEPKEGEDRLLLLRLFHHVKGKGEEEGEEGEVGDTTLTPITFSPPLLVVVAPPVAIAKEIGREGGGEGGRGGRPEGREIGLLLLLLLLLL